MHGLLQVVDVGSGRGYLGCHLSLMYHIPVIGIDSSPSNTSSAAKRTRLLRKHWHGLVSWFEHFIQIIINIVCQWKRLGGEGAVASW